MNTRLTSPRSNHQAARSEDSLAQWTQALRIWLMVGALAVVCFPTLRGVDAWFGWMPFWLVVAPALDLAVLRRRQLTAQARAAMSRFWRQRRSRRQAKPLQRRSMRPRRSAHATASTRSET